MSLQLLVAVDSRTVQRVLEIACSSADIGARFVARADAALAALSESHFDAAIVDLDLQGIDGYALCQRLQRSAATGPLPVLLLTSEQHPYDPARAKHVNAAGSLPKPFELQSLVAAVQQAIAAPHAQTLETTAARARPAAKPSEPDGDDAGAFDSALAALIAGPRAAPEVLFDEAPPPAATVTAAATIVRPTSAGLRAQSRVEPSEYAGEAQERAVALEPAATPPAGAIHSAGASRADGLSEPTAALPAPLVEQLVAFLRAGPNAKETPELHALMGELLERQLSAILWQVVPGLVASEVRDYLARTPGHGAAAAAPANPGLAPEWPGSRPL